MPSPRELADRALEATVVLSFTNVGYAVRRRLFDFDDPSAIDMRGRTVLITGANSGLGFATARQLAATGASIRMLVRSSDKGDDTVRRLVAATGNDDVDYGVADLADLSSVRSFAESFRAANERLDVLIHNAGAMFDQREQTVDGIEKTLQVHVVGPFLLTTELLPLLEASAPSRVITVTSGGMYAEELKVRRLQSERDYRPTVAYARAKRAQVVLNRMWGECMIQRGVDFQAMHPGWAATPGVERSLPGFNRLMGPFLRTEEQGADTSVWLATSDAPREHPGSLWLDRRRRSEHKLPNTRHERSEEWRLWDEIARLAGVQQQAASR